MNASTRPDGLVPLGDWREPEPDAAPSESVPARRLLLEGAVVFACAGFALVVLLAISLRDTLAFPFSDAHDWAAEALRTERSGAWLGYLWRPHGAQRIPWARAAEAVFLEAPGHPPAFLLFGLALWGLGAVALVLLLVRSAGGGRVRLWLGAAAALLLSCAPLGEDFAFPVFSVYLYAAGPALAAACLWAQSGARGLRSPLFWAALVCAVLGSGGNAAGLAVWPALVCAALLAGETGAALWVLIAGAVACVVLFEAGLGAPGGAPGAPSTGLGRLMKMVVYFGSYCGLPWSRALRFPLVGALVGWPLAVAAGMGLARAGRLRTKADRWGSVRRAGAALALFGLATGVLATLGRVDELAQPVVPTRYAPFALLVQVGALLLYADRLEGWIAHRRVASTATAVAAAALVLGADLRGAHLLDKTADHIRAASRAFDAGLPADIPMHPHPEAAHAVRSALIARGLPG